MAAGGGRRVTSSDVAREAGVSRGTVFNVLTGSVVVRPETAARVRAAIDRLGYVPSAAARILRGGPNRVVLMVSPATEAIGGLGAVIVDALGRALADRGLTLVWQLGLPSGSAPYLDLTPAVVLTAPTPDDPEFVQLAAGFRVPVLPAFPGRDEHVAAAGRVQVEHLASLGVRTVLVVQPRDAGLAGMAGLRARAVQATATALGVHVSGAVRLPDDRAGWATAVRGWVEAADGPLGVCAFNDEVALEILAGAHDAGVAVPGRLLVVGADDTAAAVAAVPALSTVGVDTGDFVARLADAVAAASRGEDVEPPRLPTNLVVVARESSQMLGSV